MNAAVPHIDRRPAEPVPPTDRGIAPNPEAATRIALISERLTSAEWNKLVEEARAKRALNFERRFRKAEAVKPAPAAMADLLPDPSPDRDGSRIRTAGVVGIATAAVAVVGMIAVGTMLTARPPAITAAPPVATGGQAVDATPAPVARNGAPSRVAAGSGPTAPRPDAPPSPILAASSRPAAAIAPPQATPASAAPPVPAPPSAAVVAAAASPPSPVQAARDTGPTVPPAPSPSAVGRPPPVAATPPPLVAASAPDAVPGADGPDAAPARPATTAPPTFATAAPDAAATASLVPAAARVAGTGPTTRAAPEPDVGPAEVAPPVETTRIARLRPEPPAAADPDAAPAAAAAAAPSSADGPSFAGLEIVLKGAAAGAGRLEASGATVTVEPTILRPARATVRVFHAADADAARRLAQAFGATVEDLTSFRPRPPEGRVELLLP